jgi:molecular chaperone GrpE (heat shock protein)
MTDWKKTAAALDPPIPDAAIEKLLPVMDALEAAFRPLQQSLTAEDDIWTGVE